MGKKRDFGNMMMALKENIKMGKEMEKEKNTVIQDIM